MMYHAKTSHMTLFPSYNANSSKCEKLYNEQTVTLKKLALKVRLKQKIIARICFTANYV